MINGITGAGGGTDWITGGGGWAGTGMDTTGGWCTIVVVAGKVNSRKSVAYGLRQP